MEELERVEKEKCNQDLLWKKKVSVLIKGEINEEESIFMTNIKKNSGQ